MRTTKVCLVAALAALLAMPLAAAQNDSPDLDVTETPEDVDANLDAGDGPEESSAAGLSTTVVIILVVLAVLVVALIVAMSNRT